MRYTVTLKDGKIFNGGQTIFDTIAPTRKFVRFRNVLSEDIRISKEEFLYIPKTSILYATRKR